MTMIILLTAICWIFILVVSGLTASVLGWAGVAAVAYGTAQVLLVVALFAIVSLLEMPKRSSRVQATVARQPVAISLPTCDWLRSGSWKQRQPSSFSFPNARHRRIDFRTRGRKSVLEHAFSSHLRRN